MLAARTARDFFAVRNVLSVRVEVRNVDREAVRLRNSGTLQTLTHLARRNPVRVARIDVNGRTGGLEDLNCVAEQVVALRHRALAQALHPCGCIRLENDRRTLAGQTLREAAYPFP